MAGCSYACLVCFDSLMEKVLSIDLDNVLVETATAFLQFYGHAIQDKKLEYTDISEYYLHDIPHLELSKEDNGVLWDKFFNEVTIDQMSVVAGALDIVPALSAAWYKMFVVTWRWINRLEITRAWVEHWFDGLFEDILFWWAMTNDPIDKGTLCQRIWADMHIDDYLIFAREALLQLMSMCYS